MYFHTNMSFISYLNEKLDLNAKVKFKDQSKFMKFLNFFIRLWNKDFMKHYTTVIGNTFYFPSEEWFARFNRKEIIAHEFVHLYDNKKILKIPFAFSLLYLFPQILSIFAIFFFLSPWFLLFLFCLVPIPAPGRWQLESRGYSMSMFFRSQAYKASYDIDADVLNYIDRFTTSSYYYMWPFKESVKNQLFNDFNTLSYEHPVFFAVKEWFKS